MHELKKSYKGRQFLQARGKTVLDYLQSAATFTRGMAKRTGDVFAAAPIIQGNWDGSGTGDVLSAPRGAQIDGHWYAALDGYQWYFFTFWTPEQAFTAGSGKVYLFYASAAHYFAYDYDNNRFEVCVGTQIVTAASNIVAGTRLALVAGGSSIADLDGTNYGRISINNVHTYGAPTQPTASAPGATIYIGSNNGANACNGILEGSVLVREVPWDGTFGTNLGFGDIIEDHYAAGAFADVADSIGPWGTTFSLPTDSTPGAITSGPGESWSMIHGSNVLTDGFCETAYGGSAWGDEGTPSVGPADLAAGDKMFQWGYKWTCDAANEGITQTLAGLDAQQSYVIRVLAHCVSADDIRIRLWDETNAEQMDNTVDFDFGASSSRTAPGVALFTFQLPTIARNGVGADCVSFSVKVLGTANNQEVLLHQVEIYENLIDNPSLEVGAGNPWIPTGWTNLGLDAGDSAAEAGVIHSGAGSMLWNVGAEEGEIIYQFLTGATGRYLAYGGWFYGDGAKGHQLGATSAARALLQFSDTDYLLAPSVVAEWKHASGVWRQVHATDASLGPFTESGAGGARYFDDLYAFLCDPVALTVTPANEANSEEGVTTELRVDGFDTLTQPLEGQCKLSSGYDRAWIRPRHNPADLLKFGNSPYWVFFDGDANNYILVYGQAANNIRLWARVAGGGALNADWDCTGAWVANDKLFVEVEYKNRWIQLRVNGVVRATIATVVTFTTAPTTAYWGSNAAGTQQGDLTFDEP